MTNPNAEIAVYGPEAGYVVDIRGGGAVSTSVNGSDVVAMPYTVAKADDLGGAGPSRGMQNFYVTYVRGTPVQLHVIVTGLDGTILLDRNLTALPAAVDAVARTVRYGDPFGADLTPVA